MKKLMVSTLFISSCLMSFSSFATNYAFLADTAISNFTSEDARLFKAAESKALNTKPDNSKVTWSNPETGAHGYLVPIHTTKEQGMVCRQLVILNIAAHREGRAIFKYCRINNTWKIVS